MFIHELHTPISIISMGLNILNTNNNNIDNNIVKDLQKSIIYIENIFTKFALIQDDNITLNSFEPFSLNILLQDILSLFQYIIEDADILFELKINAEIHDWNYGDAHNIKHCIINLLNNAIKYRNLHIQTIITIEITKLYDDTNNNNQTIFISINDNNDHILPHIKRHLFELFNSTNGSGLGLYICKNIIELHNGFISHQYIQPFGNQFTITLSLKLAEDPNLYPQLDLNKNIEKKINTLLVDDNISTLKMLHLILRKMNKFKYIYIAKNGIESIKKIEYFKNKLYLKNRINIIFLDRYMIDIDGISVAKSLRKMSYTQLIIGITDDGNKNEHYKFLRSGVDYVFTKPLDEIKIQMVIDFITKYGSMHLENKIIQKIDGKLEWI